MSGSGFFLDTDVVVYAFHPEASLRQKVAGGLMEKAQRGKGILSFQVVQEFINLALRKFKPAPPVPEIRKVVEDILLPLCKVLPNPSFYLDALDTQQLTKLSWHDSLILHAAAEARCDTLYSEDLQDGFRYRGVTVVNPFR